MRTFFIMLFMVFCVLFTMAFAEVYIVTDKDSQDIVTMSEKNDTVISANQALTILPGKYENYDLSENPTNYKFKNAKFILNTKRINDLEDNRIAAEEKAAEEKIINERIRKQAIDALKAEGVVLKHN